MVTPTRFRLAVSLIMLGVALGCSATAGSPDRDWSRTYAGPLDRVWRAALATLAEAGYEIEDSDRERGRIRAAPSSAPSGRGVVLEVRLRERGELILVDVQGGGGLTGSPADLGRIEQAVLELLHALDGRLREQAGGTP